MVVCRRDNRFYKRYNFSSVPLDEREVQIKYRAIGITENTINRRLNKCIERLHQYIPKTIDEGLLSFSITPFNLHTNYFCDMQKIDNILSQQRHPDYLGYGSSLRRRQDRFQKPLIFGENNFPYLVENNDEIISLQKNIAVNTNLILGLTRKENNIINIK